MHSCALPLQLAIEIRFYSKFDSMVVVGQFLTVSDVFSMVLSSIRTVLPCFDR